EIERAFFEILAGEYKRIALQFPDELLVHDSVPMYRLLKAGLGLGRELYVLVIPPTAGRSHPTLTLMLRRTVPAEFAQYVDVDAMAHYSHACMTHDKPVCCGLRQAVATYDLRVCQ
ncbi:hypothetical protein C8J57DRAFT_1094181, partial [Mycena rebaudengoi]